MNARRASRTAHPQDSALASLPEHLQQVEKGELSERSVHAFFAAPRALSGVRLAQQLVDARHDLVDVEGLFQKALLERGGRELLVRSGDQDGHLLGARIGAEDLTKALCVEQGTSDVEEDQVGRPQHAELQRPSPILHRLDAVASPTQRRREQACGLGVRIGDEDVAKGHQVIQYGCRS
jgi:hypothetical protein